MPLKNVISRAGRKLVQKPVRLTKKLYEDAVRFVKEAKAEAKQSYHSSSDLEEFRKNHPARRELIDLIDLMDIDPNTGRATYKNVVLNAMDVTAKEGTGMYKAKRTFDQSGLLLPVRLAIDTVLFALPRGSKKADAYYEFLGVYKKYSADPVMKKRIFLELARLLYDNHLRSPDVKHAPSHMPNLEKNVYLLIAEAEGFVNTHPNFMSVAEYNFKKEIKNLIYDPDFSSKHYSDDFAEVIRHSLKDDFDADNEAQLEVIKDLNKGEKIARKGRFVRVNSIIQNLRALRQKMYFISKIHPQSNPINPEIAFSLLSRPRNKETMIKFISKDFKRKPKDVADAIYNLENIGVLERMMISKDQEKINSALSSDKTGMRLNNIVRAELRSWNNRMKKDKDFFKGMSERGYFNYFLSQIRSELRLSLLYSNSIMVSKYRTDKLPPKGFSYWKRLLNSFDRENRLNLKSVEDVNQYVSKISNLYNELGAVAFPSKEQEQKLRLIRRMFSVLNRSIYKDLVTSKFRAF